MNVSLLRYTDRPAQLIVEAARTCKNSLSRSDSSDKELGPNDVRLVKSCIEAGHESIMEHVSFSFRLDLSRVAQQQLTRHRLASFSAESARAVVIDGPLEEKFFRPPAVALNEDASLRFWTTLDIALSSYKRLLSQGIPVEEARYLLPLALVQPMVVTANLREWRHIIRERTCKHAQYEIRSAVKQIRAEIYRVHPVLTYNVEKCYTCREKEGCSLAITSWENFSGEKKILPVVIE